MRLYSKYFLLRQILFWSALFLSFVVNGQGPISPVGGPQKAGPSYGALPSFNPATQKKVNELLEVDDTLHLNLVDNAQKLWLLFEETMNHQDFIQPTRAKTVHLVPYPLNEVKIELGERSDFRIMDKFIHSTAPEPFVYVPVHPFNTDSSVAGFDKLNAVSPDVSKMGDQIKGTSTLQGRFTASRSMVILSPDVPPFGLKMGTNFPHASIFSPSPHKASTLEDVHFSINRSNYMDGVESIIGKDPQMDFLREMGAISLIHNKKAGFVVRDLTPLLQPDEIYIPAFSIPYIGEKIARFNDEEFAPFWERVYGKTLGEAKAKLLIRYGLQLETPNAQNMILVFDHNFRPKYKIIFRDISDTTWVAPVIDRIFPRCIYKQEDELLAQALQLPLTSVVVDFIYASFDTSLWMFGDVDDVRKGPLPHKIVEKWSYQQAEGYLDFINKELGTKIRSMIWPIVQPKIYKFYKERLEHFYHFKKYVPIADHEFFYMAPIYRFLTSKKGEAALKEYRQNKFSRFLSGEL